MYCVKCGNKLVGNENYCISCGNLINYSVNEQVNVKKNGDKTISIVLGIFGIVGSLMFIFAPISLILSIVGLVYGIKVNKRVGNVLGIVLNIISLFLSLIISLIIFFALFFSWYTVRDGINNFWQEESYYEERVDYNNGRDF